MSVAAQSPIRSLRELAIDIKLGHSVFALPFALLAAAVAAIPSAGSIDWRRALLQLLLIVVAMVSARTVAMIANRILDRRIDAANPRTATRALPAGRLSTRFALASGLACATVFMAACVAFGVFLDNWWPATLGVPVLAWISAYGLFKRFTALCHVYLGSSLAISPVAAALAIDPTVLGHPAVWLLAAMVLCWVAGFDVLYALQDVQVDRRDRLHSMPSRWGVTPALWTSRCLHLLAWSALVGFARTEPRLSWIFDIAVVAAGSLLIIEHLTVERWGTSRLSLAVFTLNGLISCLIGGLGIVDLCL